LDRPYKKGAFRVIPKELEEIKSQNILMFDYYCKMCMLKIRKISAEQNKNQSHRLFCHENSKYISVFFPCQGAA
jgi:hypothetical protein